LEELLAQDLRSMKPGDVTIVRIRKIRPE